jgi:hypothetical protein
MNKKVKKYAVLFKFFTNDDIAQFLREISSVPHIKYTIHEEVIQNKIENTKTNNTNLLSKFSKNSMNILHIIDSLRDLVLLKDIARFLNYEIYLKQNYRNEHLSGENCGVVIKNNGKKLDLSINGCINQLRESILNNLNGEKYGE